MKYITKSLTCCLKATSNKTRIETVTVEVMESAKLESESYFQ